MRVAQSPRRWLPLLPQQHQDRLSHAARLQERRPRQLRAQRGGARLQCAAPRAPRVGDVARRCRDALANNAH
eukprot:3067000-Pleurochrysis_carterae.AAC.1